MSTTTKKKETVSKPEEEGVEPEEVMEEKEVVSAAGEPTVSLSLVQQMIAEALAKQKAELEEKFKEKKEEVREPAPVTYKNGNGDVKIVWLCSYDGVLNKVPGINLVCHYYGETFTLSRPQFDSVVGEYRRWFDKGMLAVHHSCIEVAAEKGLKTEDEYALSAKKLEKLGTMSPSDIRKLWEDCDNDAQRLSIVSFYKRKFMEGKEPGYRNSDRILELNKLTNQGLKREAIEISGASLKITPTDFMNY